MPLFEQPQYLLTPVKTGAYTAFVGEMVIVDTTIANVPITAPTNPENGDVFAVKEVSTDGNFINVDGGAALIESALDIETSGASTSVFGSGAIAEWIYDDVSNVWFNVNTNKIPSYAELWQGTNILGVGVGSTINFTFVPLFTGQSPEIVTHLTGEFTEQLKGAFDLSTTFVKTFISTSNNAEAELSVSYDDSITIISTPHFDAFQSSRSGSFKMSGEVGGILPAVPGNVFSIGATLQFSTAMAIDLTDIFLFIRL